MIKYTNTIAIMIFFFETRRNISDFVNFIEEGEGQVTDLSLLERFK